MNDDSNQAAISPQHLGLMVVSLLMATIMQAIDMTIANVALPQMQGSLSATHEQISWSFTAYVVASAIMTPPAGFLASRFGRKNIFLIAVAAFTFFSILCGTATNLEQLIAYRICQGASGAIFAPLSQATLLDAFPRRRHGQAMALFGIGMMFGPIIGPTLGGWLTEFYSWRWVFFINLPFGLLALIGIYLFVPDYDSNPKIRFDIFGFTLIAIAIGALQLMLDRGVSQYWFDSLEIVIYCILTFLCAYMFVVHINTTRDPFIDPSLFRDLNFSTSIFFIFINGITMLATLILLPNFVQILLGYPVLTAGYMMAPRSVGTVVAMLLVGRFINRFDPRLIILGGMLLSAYSFWEMTKFSLDTGAYALIYTGVVQGFAFGMAFVPLSTIAYSTLAPSRRTEAAALFNLSRNIGSSVGISIVITILATSIQRNHAIINEAVTPFSEPFRSLYPFYLISPDTIPVLSVVEHEILRQAMMVSYLNDFKFLMVITLVFCPLVWILRRPALD